MGSFNEYLQAKGHSMATAKMYNYYLLDFITWSEKQNIDTAGLTSGDLMVYMAQLKQRELANTSRNNHLIAIRHYFNWQQQKGDREDNPASLVKLRGTRTRKLYPILAKEELEQIYHQYDAGRSPKGRPHTHEVQQLTRQRNKAMLSLIVYQGLLTSEVNALTLQDVKLREGMIYVAGGRSSNERELELKPQQIIELMEYRQITRKTLLQQGDPARELLFLPAPASGQKRATANDSMYTWKRLTQEVKAQCPRLVNMLHIRTCVITHWLKQYNLRQVQYMAGHRYASTTEGYLVNQIEDLQQDIDQFHPLG